MRPPTLWLVCTGCLRVSSMDAKGWKAYLTREDPPEAAVYCPECAAREFGDA